MYRIHHYRCILTDGGLLWGGLLVCAVEPSQGPACAGCIISWCCVYCNRCCIAAVPIHGVEVSRICIALRCGCDVKVLLIAWFVCLMHVSLCGDCRGKRCTGGHCTEAAAVCKSVDVADVLLLLLLEVLSCRDCLHALQSSDHVAMGSPVAVLAGSSSRECRMWWQWPRLTVPLEVIMVCRFG